MTFQAISRAQNLHTPRYMAGKQFHNGHGGQEYRFFWVFWTWKFTKFWGGAPSKGTSILIPIDPFKSTMAESRSALDRQGARVGRIPLAER